ncbi:hypothetical protein CONCODRAFT_2664 [Conidiobolus coronatus NRRL 28638]|uniref:Uncharacterized protein n=1 Tax=Conidiobolus coronatus (strain ATCC 28846 / CBS 209.66 / NRRL 28638) TaxID=796925 RepID=A0A137PH39_CONC2|nr:hypothetical protein CONCODRAFT_2664 [Conidiobolus coronatus NRRL 28638]|eukprot:KXN74285.1 hypothetical protein CONCODRAFT_2664 [Conidiobolus coronatus NRRL 28638]
MNLFDVGNFYGLCAVLTTVLMFSDIPIYLATSFPVYSKKITITYVVCNILILSNAISLAFLANSDAYVAKYLVIAVGTFWVSYTQSYLIIIYLTTVQVLGNIKALRIMKYVSIFIGLFQFSEYIVWVLSLWIPEEYNLPMDICDKISVTLISLSEIVYSIITIYYMRDMIPIEYRIKFEVIILKLVAIMLMFCCLDISMMILEYTNLGVYTYCMKHVFFYIKLRCEYMCLFKLKQIILVCIQEAEAY